MSLQPDRIQTLCEELKLAGVAESFATLATRAVDTEQSFVDFLENALIAERDCRRARSGSDPRPHGGLPGHQDDGGLRLQVRHSGATPPDRAVGRAQLRCPARECRVPGPVGRGQDAPRDRPRPQGRERRHQDPLHDSRRPDAAGPDPPCARTAWPT